MNQRHSLAITAGAATLLAAFPMSTIFTSLTWFFYAALAIVAVTGSAMLVRAARGPAWAQVLGMLAGLLLFVTVIFPSGAEWGRFIPSGATFVHFNDLLVQAGEQIRSQAPPVPDLDGLLLLTTVGIGMVAMLVDLAAVGLRRPALAGLPMLALYSVPVAVVPDSLSFLPFVFAAAGYIWLLISDSVDRVRRFGRRFTGEGRDVDVWEASPLSSAGRRLGIAGIAVAILIPLAIPGMTGGLLTGWGDDGTGSGDGPPREGGSAAVDLSGFLEGQLNRTEITDMVRVTTSDPSPFYLRIGVADQVRPQGFVTRAAAGNPIGEMPGDYVAPQVPGVFARPYQADIEILNLNMNLAPIYEQVTRVSGLGQGWFHEPSTNQIFSRRESVAGRKYTVDYVKVSYTPAALRTAAGISGNDPIRQLAVVPNIQYVSDLVSQLTAGRTNQYDQVRAIYEYFTTPGNGFSYSLSTKEGDTGSPIVDFLTTKTGYCVQYAAAMAWLVRAAGYPARVAFGYTAGNGLVNGAYTLTNFNLHSWTEVYFPGFGWVPFDATPAGSVVGSVQTVWAPDLTRPEPSASASGDPGELFPDDPSAGPSASGGAGGQGGNSGTGPTLINSWWLIGAAGLTLLIALILIPAMRRRSLSRQRRARTGELITVGAATRPPEYVIDPAGIDGARRDAHAAWAELRDSMIDFRVDVNDAETPRATAERLNTLLQPGVTAPAVDESDVVGDTPVRRRGPRHALPVAEQTALLARAEERARYARLPLHPHGLDAAVAAAREAMAERATRWQRIGAVLLPRSVLQRWRASWMNFLARNAARASRIREASAVVSPRRLLTRSAR